MTTLELVTLERNAALKAFKIATGSARVGAHEALFGPPHPLWADAWPSIAARPEVEAPVLLRYRNDEFMERFLEEVGSADHEWAAVGVEDALLDEDGSGDGRVLEGGAATSPFKLFQPFHGDFHLVSCSFLCREVGYPDRAIDPAKLETLFYVIRRRWTVPGVVTDEGVDQQVEEAWVPDTGWVKVGSWDSVTIEPDEERFPLFATKAGWGRTVYFAYLPVASRETYSVFDLVDPLSAPTDSLRVLADDVMEPLRYLRDEGGRDASRALAGKLHAAIASVPPLLAALTARSTTGLPTVYLSDYNELLALTPFSELEGGWWDVAQESKEPPGAAPFAYDLSRVLFSEFESAPDVLPTAWPGVLNSEWTALVDARIRASFGPALALLRVLEGSFPLAAQALVERAELTNPGSFAGNPPLTGVDEDAYDLVLGAEIDQKTADNEDREVVELAEGLAWLREYRSRLVSHAETASGDDPFEPLQVSIVHPDDLPAPDDATPLEMTKAELPSHLAEWPYDLTRLDAEGFPNALLEILRELGPDGEVPEAEVASSFTAPKYPPQAAPEGEVHFVVRAVYEKADCVPPRVLYSEASEPFVPASTFDADAPARDIRFALPTDLSAATMAKFKKGLGIMMSDAMRKKQDDAKLAGLPSDVKTLFPEMPPPPLPGPPQFEMGFLVSLSIPIVTICAFILLLIVASILHMIFRWLPYLIVVIPLKLKAKL